MSNWWFWQDPWQLKDLLKFKKCGPGCELSKAYVLNQNISEKDTKCHEQSGSTLSTTMMFPNSVQFSRLLYYACCTGDDAHHSRYYQRLSTSPSTLHSSPLSLVKFISNLQQISLFTNTSLFHSSILLIFFPYVPLFIISFYFPTIFIACYKSSLYQTLLTFISICHRDLRMGLGPPADSVTGFTREMYESQHEIVM